MSSKCACGRNVEDSFVVSSSIYYGKKVSDGYCTECETRCCSECFRACSVCNIEDGVVLRGLCLRCDAKLADFYFFQCAEGHAFRLCRKCHEHDKDESGKIQCAECRFDHYFDYRFETEDWSAGLFRCKPQ